MQRKDQEGTRDPGKRRQRIGQWVMDRVGHSWGPLGWEGITRRSSVALSPELIKLELAVCARTSTNVLAAQAVNVPLGKQY